MANSQLEIQAEFQLMTKEVLSQLEDLDYADKTHFQYIIIPSNCSFIAYDEKIQAIEKYIEKFK